MILIITPPTGGDHYAERRRFRSLRPVEHPGPIVQPFDDSESDPSSPSLLLLLPPVGPLSDYGTLSGSHSSLSTVACSVQSEDESSPLVEEHDDSAYGGAYARHYTDEASEVDISDGIDISDGVEAPLSLLLCPEDMSATSDSASVEEADPLSREELERHGFKWVFSPDEAYVDPYKEDSGSDSDTRSIIITHVLPAAEVERRRRLFAGIPIDLE